MAKQYVSGLIGDEYKSWKEGDHVIIATPTGSGKTTFVIARLLMLASSEHKHVVYYCNRKVLHDQFEGQAQGLIKKIFGSEFEPSEAVAKYLHILTYQGAELGGYYPSVNRDGKEIPEQDCNSPINEFGFSVHLHQPTHTERIHVDFHDVMFYIFDEAHYFISDALIRHETNFWCHQKFDHGISVFLTATPKPLLCFLERGRLLGGDFFYRTMNNYSNKEKIEGQYDIIHSTILDMVNRWKWYDDFSMDLKKAHDLKGAFMRRLPHPLTECFSIIENLYVCATQRRYFYREEPDYSYIDASYYLDYITLMDQVKKTGDDKWIIFVDSEKKGEDLLNMIAALNLGSAALLSSKRIKENKVSAVVYEEIVQDQRFSCRILISTSVMDCGVNIIDPQVKHMSIACDNETTFLQMLGRKRMAEGERLQLYIKLYPYRSIHTRMNNCTAQLLYMVKIGLKNSTDHSLERSYLKATQMRDMRSDVCSGKHPNLFTPAEDLGIVEKERIQNSQKKSFTNNDTFLYGLTYSTTAMVLMLNRMYDYNLAMIKYRKETGFGTELADFIYSFYEKFAKSRCNLGDFAYNYYDPHSAFNSFHHHWKYILRQKPEDNVLHFDLSVDRDDHFFLKHQLSWIGKEYDPSCWLLGSEKLLELTTYLDAAVESRPLRQDTKYNEQHEFGMQCIQLMLELPIPPNDLRRNKSRFGKARYPGKNVLNKYFGELSLPYMIDSKREKYDGMDKKTTWVVKYIDPDKDQTDGAAES